MNAIRRIAVAAEEVRKSTTTSLSNFSPFSYIVLACPLWVMVDRLIPYDFPLTVREAFHGIALVAFFNLLLAVWAAMALFLIRVVDPANMPEPQGNRRHWVSILIAALMTVFIGIKSGSYLGDMPKPLWVTVFETVGMRVEVNFYDYTKRECERLAPSQNWSCEVSPMSDDEAARLSGILAENDEADQMDRDDQEYEPRD